jgi:hypothetical protein
LTIRSKAAFQIVGRGCRFSILSSIIRTGVMLMMVEVPVFWRDFLVFTEKHLS